MTKLLFSILFVASAYSAPSTTQKLISACLTQEGLKELADVDAKKYCKCMSNSLGNLTYSQKSQIIELYSGKISDDAYAKDADGTFELELAQAGICMKTSKKTDYKPDL